MSLEENQAFMSDHDWIKLSDQQCPDYTLGMLRQIGMQGGPIPRDVLICLVQGCLEKKNLLLAREAHSLIVGCGLASVSVLQDLLIRAFSSCGSLVEANLVFGTVCNPGAQTWSSVISAHTKRGEGKVALGLYNKLQWLGRHPDRFLFLSALAACSCVRSIYHGASIHSHIIESETVFDLVVANTLVDMYAKCNCLEEAQAVFDRMVDRDVVSWNALIAGYVHHELGCTALDLFEGMQVDGVSPCDVTYLCALKACGTSGLAGKGKLVHEQIVRCGLASDISVANALIDMYCKCGCLDEAHHVLKSLQSRTIVSWGAIIAGYATHGHGLHGFESYKEMLQDGIKPNRVILSSMLKACTSLSALDQGMLIHEQVIMTALKYDVIIGNTLIDMYVKCGSLEDAQRVFDSLHDKDIVSWNSIISGYAQQGCVFLALDYFGKMQQANFQPCEALILCILKVCASTGSTAEGMLLHLQIIERGLETDVMLGNTLVDMYAKLGKVVEAHTVFENLQGRTLVSWGAIMTGYTSQGQNIPALKLFVRMMHEGKTANEVIYVTILRACTSIRDSVLGGILHDYILRSGLESDIIVGNALIDMYVKCGGQEEGRKVFDNLSHRDVVSWGAMLDGYVQNGDCYIALELFCKMQEEGRHPNRVVFLLALRACSGTGAADHGRLIHHQIFEIGVQLEDGIITTLIDMYTSCGSMLDAKRVLCSLRSQDVASWNALIAGYSQHGNCELALQCFEIMQQEGCKPDGYTFTSLLAAFSHRGQVEKGYKYFKLMRDVYGVKPTSEHLSCMVDLLARVGRLAEAAGFLETMPITPNSAGWLSLLTACRTFGSMEMGSRCYNESIQLNPEGASGYMLLSNIFADYYMWDNMLEVKESRKFASAWRKPGRACIQIESTLQQFVVGDKSHPQIDIIVAQLAFLSRQSKELGYLPQVNLVLESGLSNE